MSTCRAGGPSRAGCSSGSPRSSSGSPWTGGCSVGRLLGSAQEVEGLEGNRAAPVEGLERREHSGVGGQLAHRGDEGPRVLDAVSVGLEILGQGDLDLLRLLVEARAIEVEDDVAV